MNLSPLFRKVLFGAGEASLDIAGSAFLPGAWPVLKAALEPVLDRLKERLGGENIAGSPERAQKAVEEFEADKYLQEMLRSGLVENLDALVRGQQAINEDVQKLMLVVSGDRELLQELVGGVERIEKKLDEGVNLSPEAIEKLTRALSRQAENSRQVRALALREMGPVAELIGRQVHRLQIRAVELIDDKQLDRARDELREGLLLVAALLKEAPTDVHLLMQMAMIYKTQAQVQTAAGQTREAEDSLVQAEKVFRFVKDGVAGDKKTALDMANAIHGLGNMKQMQREFAAAIENYELAVSFYPDHCYAWHDMFLCYVELAGRGEADMNKMRRALEKVKETGKGQPGLGAKHIGRLEDILRRLGEGAKQHSGHQPGKIQPSAGGGMSRLVARNFTLVIWEPHPGAILFNLDCEIVNESSSPMIVQRMDARATTPSGENLNFRWNIFYNVRPPQSAADAMTVMTKTGDVREIELQSGEAWSLGIQFQGPEVGPNQFWPAGEYRFELEGSLKGEPGQEQKALKTFFTVSISEYEKDRIDYWVKATEEQWDALNDPDRAVGIPLKIRDQKS